MNVKRCPLSFLVWDDGFPAVKFFHERHLRGARLGGYDGGFCSGGAGVAAGILVSVLLCNAAATGVFLVLGIISPGPMNDVLEIALFVVSAGVTIGLVAVAISKIWKGIKRNH